MKFLSHSLGLASLLLVAKSGAATLAQYTGGPTAGTFLTSPTTFASGITAGNLTSGSGLGFAASGVDFPGTASVPALLYGGSITTTSTSIAAAETANQFFTFLLTPSAGQQVSLTSVGWIGNANNANATHNITLEINTGAGFSTIGTYKLVNESNSTTPATADNVSFDLSSLPAITTATTFRFVMWNDAATTTGGSTSRLDDLTLSGTVSPVPEPATSALICGAAAVFGLRRRRA